MGTLMGMGIRSTSSKRMRRYWLLFLAKGRRRQRRRLSVVRVNMVSKREGGREGRGKGEVGVRRGREGR